MSGMSLQTPTPATWALGQSLARVGRLARKELSEILRDRRTVITLLLMPLLLYPLLSFAFQQFLPTLLPSELADHELVIAVPAGTKPIVEEVLGIARARPLGEAEAMFAVAMTGPAGPAPSPLLAATGVAAKDRHDESSHRPAGTKQIVEEVLGIARARPLGEAMFAVAMTGPAGPAPSPLLAATGVAAKDRHDESSHLPAVRLPGRYHPGGAPQPPLAVRIVESQDVQSILAKEDIDAVLEVTVAPDSKPWDRLQDWRVIYMDQSSRGRLVVDYLEQHLAVANARIVQRQLDSRWVAVNSTPVRLIRSPIPPDAADGGAVLSMTAVVPLILILMTITGAVYPAIDLTAGERERGTLEILVSAPVPRMALLLAKYVAVVTVAIMTATINLVMMLITLEYNKLTSLVFKQNGVTLELVLQLFFLLVLFATFFSAVLLALTSFARSFKEAQAYLVPLMLVSLAPGVLAMIPGLRLQGPLTVTPLVNIVLLARDLAEGHATTGVAATVVLSTLVYAVAAIAVAARIFGAEAVLYSDQSGWYDLFRRPEQPQPAPSVAGALFCLALMFPVFFLLVGLAPNVPEDQRLTYQIFGTLLLFVGFPLLGCWLARIRVLSALQLPLPPVIAWPAALVLALACVPVLYHVVAWMRDLGWTLPPPGQMRQMRFLLRSWRPVFLAGYVASIGAAEEIFFRGYLFSALRARAGAWLTVIVTAVLFGLFHFVTQFDRLLPSTLMGLLLGWLCWQTRSVLPGMVLHAAFNTTLMLLAYYEPMQPGTILRGPQPDDLPMWWQVVALPAGIGAAALVWWFRARPPREQPKDSQVAICPLEPVAHDVVE
jgi:ABC-2 type transport system permease protein/sodium transport system permease protein